MDALRQEQQQQPQHPWHQPFVQQGLQAPSCGMAMLPSFQNQPSGMERQHVLQFQQHSSPGHSQRQQERCHDVELQRAGAGSGLLKSSSVFHPLHHPSHQEQQQEQQQQDEASTLVPADMHQGVPDADLQSRMQRMQVTPKQMQRCNSQPGADMTDDAVSGLQALAVSNANPHHHHHSHQQQQQHQQQHHHNQHQEAASTRRRRVVMFDDGLSFGMQPDQDDDDGNGTHHTDSMDTFVDQEQDLAFLMNQAYINPSNNMFQYIS